MCLLVSGSTRSVLRAAASHADTLGHLLTPACGNAVASVLATGLPWAADNGCFRGFDERRFRRFLEKITAQPRCLFVVAPDVVGDSAATLDLFGRWKDELAATRLPLAFAGQDGAESRRLPWDWFDCWFVGGSTRWKLSAASFGLCLEAKARGKHVHFGRVNSRRRMEAAHSVGADSIDGGSASMFGDCYVGKFCRWLAHLYRQPSLYA